MGKFIVPTENWTGEFSVPKSHHMNSCYWRVLRLIIATDVITEDCFSNGKCVDDCFPTDK